MNPSDSEPPSKSKRKRRTRAEIEAERQAKADAEAEAADEPIDPKVWIIFGGLILIIAAWTWLDPTSFAEAGQTSDRNILQYLPLLLIQLVGRNPALIILILLGGIPLIWGIVGWVRKHLGSGN